MAEARQRNMRVVRRLRGIGAVFALVAIVVAAAPASAGPKQRLDNAKARLEQLRREITRQQAVVDRLSAQTAVIGQRLDQAQAQLELITEQLMQTRQELDGMRQRYQDLRQQLNDRLRQTYMNGPASGLEFVLGAQSFGDLSDRLEYVDALAQTDADLATQVENAKNDLAAQARAQERLQQEQTAAVAKWQSEQAALDAKFAEQQKALDSIQAKKEQAQKLVSKRTKQYNAWLRSLSTVHVAGSGVFRVCPVDQPRVVTDGFGAPRYSGGYHPHAGDDIMAPLNTPIRAPFDGVAYTSYNSLGGNAVYVKGSAGYVYNAHLDHYSNKSNGPVKAGDIIGYVGWTGDAYGGVYHDHFEWHPYNTPSADAWPRSPYGYSVIDTGYGEPAVNPYPLLEQVC